MNDLYDFKSVIAVKLLIRKQDQILILREPKTNEWMPGRFGLPGGKPLLGESVLSAIERKIKTEVGLEIRINGLVKIFNILMPSRNVYHLIVLADYISGEIGEQKTESDELSWLSRGDLDKLTVDDFAEYYYKSLLDEYFNNVPDLVPIDIASVQDNRCGDPLAWLQKGAK